MSDIRSLVTSADIKKLYRIKTISMPIDSILNKNAKPNYETYITQFKKDVIMYGMWEAILYAQGYEHHGFYNDGTANLLIKEVLRTL